MFAGFIPSDAETNDGGGGGGGDSVKIL
jgi:hypothetical protein